MAKSCGSLFAGSVSRFLTPTTPHVVFYPQLAKIVELDDKIVRILWLSRHKPLKSEIDELKRIFGEIYIIQYPNKVENAEHVLNLIEYFGADEIVAVLPLTIIAKITEKGVKPLRAEMTLLHTCKSKPCPDFDPDRDWIDPTSKRHFRFTHFSRIHQVRIISERL